MARIFILVFIAGLVAYFDQNTGKIPNELTYSLLIIGLVFNLLFFPIKIFLLILGSLLVLYIILLKFVNLDVIGGGDAMCFLGILSIMPIYPSNLISIFFIKVIFISLIIMLLTIAFQKLVWFYLNTMVTKETKFAKMLDTKVNQVYVKYGVYLFVSIIASFFFF